MAKADVTKPYHHVVMALNANREMDVADKRRDFAYAVYFLVTMFFIPIILAVLALTFDKPGLGMTLIVLSIATGLVPSLFVRQRIINRFFAVRDVRPYFALEELCEESLTSPDSVLIKPALVFRSSYDEGSLTFVYNWLRSRHALKEGSRLTGYNFRGDVIVRHYGLTIPADANFLVIPLSELSADEKAMNTIARELPMVDGTWLDLFMAALKREAAEAGPADSASAQGQAKPFVNKGQKL